MSITKGKWEFNPHEEHSEWFGNITGHPNPKDGQEIRTIACLTRYCDTDEEQMANARLIAAAPSLLLACKAARAVLDTGYALKLIKAPKTYHVQIDMVLKGLTKAIKSVEGV